MRTVYAVTARRWPPSRSALDRTKCWHFPYRCRVGRCPSCSQIEHPLTGQVPIISLRDPRKAPSPSPRRSQRLPLPLSAPNAECAVAPRVRTRAWEHARTPAVAGMVPSLPSLRQRRLCLSCRRARTTAWEHARTPVAGMAPSHCRPPPVPCHCAAAPPCSHDGIGACPHANHCWNGIPLLPASPFLCESCRHATVVTRQHRSMLACEPSP
jgi:hypothetical protein